MWPLGLILQSCTKGCNPYHPFNSSTDWSIAKWAKENNTGDNSLTRLLSIPGVVERLGLSYKDAHSLDQIIHHELPMPVGPEWKHMPVTFEQTQLDLYHRDITECIEQLYSDPSFADSMHYEPERLYADEKKASRMYEGMHTADWWFETQVRPTNYFGAESGVSNKLAGETPQWHDRCPVNLCNRQDRTLPLQRRGHGVPPLCYHR